jgi:hypothetical protein
MLLWDIMSQMPGTAQDNSSQEKQDTRPITMASPTGMLVTERKTQVTSQHPLMFFYGFPSATSRDLLCEMVDHRTAKVITDTMFHFLSGEQRGRFYDGPFAMHPVRLNAIEPGTLGRQPAGNDAHSRMALPLGCQDTLIVQPEPAAHFLTDMPGGVIPDEHQHALALRLQLLAEPLQKGRRHMADRPTIDKAQADGLALGFQHAIATQGFGIGILFADLPFQQAQRLSRFTPAMHLGLRHAAPPHLIGIAHGPATPPG